MERKEKGVSPLKCLKTAQNFKINEKNSACGAELKEAVFFIYFTFYAFIRQKLFFGWSDPLFVQFHSAK